MPQWTAWEKSNDHPGIHYRTICLGPSFEGSRFYKWQVEVYNNYPEAVSLELSLRSDQSDEANSEIKTIALIPESIKKLTFLKANQPCSELSRLSIVSLQFLD